MSLRNFDIFLFDEWEREQIRHRVATSTTRRERRYSIAKKEVCTPSSSHDSWLGILILVMTPGCHLPLFLKLVRTWASFVSSDLGTRNIAHILISMFVVFVSSINDQSFSKLCLELWFNYLSFSLWIVPLFHKMNGWPGILSSFSRWVLGKSRENLRIL